MRQARVGWVIALAGGCKGVVEDVFDFGIHSLIHEDVHQGRYASYRLMHEHCMEGSYLSNGERHENDIVSLAPPAVADDVAEVGA